MITASASPFAEMIYFFVLLANGASDNAIYFIPFIMLLFAAMIGVIVYFTIVKNKPAKNMYQAAIEAQKVMPEGKKSIREQFEEYEKEKAYSAGILFESDTDETSGETDDAEADEQIKDDDEKES